MIKVGVVGAAGYAGIELVRIILGHPEFELVRATSGADDGKPIASVYPSLAGATSLCFTAPDVADLAASCELAFLAVPHTASLAMTPALIEAGVTVVDLSADYRLHDADIYEQWYNVEHTSKDLLAQAAFGLPEFDRSPYAKNLLAQMAIAPAGSSKLVACAGCYPTATSLASMPALVQGIAKPGRIISDCQSGISGAGRKPSAKNIYDSAAQDCTAYGVTTHRHTPEMEQILSEACCEPVCVLFTPHLSPMKRGILATVYLDLQRGEDGELPTLDDIQATYEAFYKDDSFVTVLPKGVQPHTSSVYGSNNAQIGLAVDARSDTLVVTCAIDNLVKGAAGQAVQCANIICGLPETCGLQVMLPPVV